MDRTFHHRVTVGAVSGIVLLLTLAFYAFWIKSIIVGVVMALCLVLVAERTLHTEYVFHGKELIIYNGRLAKSRRIPIDSIRSCRPMASVFGIVRYLLISYGSDSNMVVAVQPANEREFVDFLRKKKIRESEEDED